MGASSAGVPADGAPRVVRSTSAAALTGPRTASTGRVWPTNLPGAAVPGARAAATVGGVVGSVGRLGPALPAPAKVVPSAKEAQGREGARAVPRVVVAEGVPAALTAGTGAGTGPGGAKAVPMSEQTRVGEARTAAEPRLETSAPSEATVGPVAAQDGVGAAVGVAARLLGTGPPAEVAPLAALHRPLGPIQDRALPCGPLRVARVGARAAAPVEVARRLVGRLGAGGVADLAGAVETVRAPAPREATVGAPRAARVAALPVL